LDQPAPRHLALPRRDCLLVLGLVAAEQDWITWDDFALLIVAVLSAVSVVLHRLPVARDRKRAHLHRGAGVDRLADLLLAADRTRDLATAEARGTGLIGQT
jgi:hypothetical protein